MYRSHSERTQIGYRPVQRFLSFQPHKELEEERRVVTSRSGPVLGSSSRDRHRERGTTIVSDPGALWQGGERESQESVGWENDERL